MSSKKEKRKFKAFYNNQSAKVRRPLHRVVDDIRNIFGN